MDGFQWNGVRTGFRKIDILIRFRTDVRNYRNQSAGGQIPGARLRSTEKITASPEL